MSANFSSFDFMELFLAPFDAFTLIITGGVIKLSSIPIFLQWLKYISPFPFTYSSLVWIQWPDKMEVAALFNGTSNFNTFSQEFPSYEYPITVNIINLIILSLCLGIIGYAGILRKKNKYYIY